MGAMTDTCNCSHSVLREKHFGDRFAFKCNGCREMGYGTCYTCVNTSCDYHLHRACKNAPSTMFHPFFNQDQFILDKTGIITLPPSPPPYHQGLANSLCDACGTSVAQGWRYVLSINGVKTNNVFLHPCCMTLPHQNLETSLPKNINCMHCQTNDGVMGWGYVSNGAAVHVKCMQVLLHKDWEERYYTASNHEHTTTQERGLGGRERAGHTRVRKRDVLLGVLDPVLRVLSFLDLLGGWDVETLVDFAGEIWGN